MNLLVSNKTANYIAIVKKSRSVSKLEIFCCACLPQNRPYVALTGGTPRMEPVPLLPGCNPATATLKSGNPRLEPI